jgi:acyl-CoA thioester hydrolase
MEQADGEALGRWPVSISLPIQWGEMDSFRHVNNVVYLRWFESARIAYFLAAGALERMEAEQVGPILARSTIDYRIPLVYPDEVLVEATALKLGNRSFTLGVRLRSRSRGGAIAAEGENVIVMLDYRAQRSIPLTAELRARILALESRPPRS